MVTKVITFLSKLVNNSEKCKKNQQLVPPGTNCFFEFFKWHHPKSAVSTQGTNCFFEFFKWHHPKSAVSTQGTVGWEGEILEICQYLGQK